MRGAASRRQPSMNTRLPPPPSTPLDHPHHFRRRDSDASFASSRPSSIGLGAISAVDLYKDRSYQQTCLNSINDYLSSHSLNFCLKYPIPQARDITAALSFLVSRLDWPSPKLEDDLPLILKSLNCPYKLNKSMIKNPTVNSHQWPVLLAVVHWIFQLVLHTDRLQHVQDDFVNAVGNYTLRSYWHYLRGQDDEVDEVDKEFMENFERQRQQSEEDVRNFQDEAVRLEAKVETLRTEASPKEKLEEEKRVLEEDVGKFHVIIENLEKNVRKMEKAVEGKVKEVEAKREEARKIKEECVELRGRVEAQNYNERDVERMRRELQALERDIGEDELGRSVWEEKVWELENTLGSKVKEMEALAMDCNQFMRRF